MKGVIGSILVAFILFSLTNCSTSGNKEFNPDKYIGYCVAQAKRTIDSIGNDTLLPRSIAKGETKWEMVPIEDWTSGFWPGTLWYLYESAGDSLFLKEAEYYTGLLKPIAYRKVNDHDLGFMMYCSYGNGYRLTGDSTYKKILLATADTLATLFNLKIGTILSWPAMNEEMNWPYNTIVDNMINLELIFWAGKAGHNPHLTDIAVKHAETTMKNHFHDDYSAYHVVIYDTVTGKKIKGVTHQGYSDESMWARGQAWAIYGFTMCYRETWKAEFLDFAQKVADIYLKRLPEDMVPYWDFDAPGIPNEPKDASAAAITASALLELSTFIADPAKSDYYKNKAVEMLKSLTSNYLSKDTNSAFLLHSTGHKPNNSEIDVPINYADYYFLEALMRLKNYRKRQNITQ